MTERKGILIVDDTLAALKLLADNLTREGYTVRPASSGESALEAIKMELPELILLDIRMPVMDGYEVCRRIKEQEASRDIPIIFLSATTDSDERVKCFEAGGVDFISKPFQRNEMLARVRTHLELSRLQTRLETLVDRRTMELKAAKEEAEAASRAKSNFLAVISHELRTPMNGIIGFANLLNDMGLNGKQKEFNRMVLESASQLFQLISDILDFSQLDTGKLKLVKKFFDVKMAVAHSIELVASQNQNADLKISFEADPSISYLVNGDKLRFRQILLNLLSNAMKFTPSGIVKIKMLQKSRTGNSAVLLLSVADCGIGIPSERISEIFEMFHQLEEVSTRKHSGIGLGLSIVKSLVKMMDGEISVESQAGKGSNFTVSLPFEIMEIDAGETGSPDALSDKTVSLLLIEDDRISQLLIATLIQQNGWDLDIADNSREALELYRMKKFDAILIDGQMSEADGFSTIEKIREREKTNGSRVPVIALTAYTEAGEYEKFIKAGMDDYILKPITDNEALLRIVTRHIKN